MGHQFITQVYGTSPKRRTGWDRWEVSEGVLRFFQTVKETVPVATVIFIVGTQTQRQRYRRKRGKTKFLHSTIRLFISIFSNFSNELFINPWIVFLRIWFCASVDFKVIQVFFSRNANPSMPSLTLPSASSRCLSERALNGFSSYLIVFFFQMEVQRKRNSFQVLGTFIHWSDLRNSRSASWTGIDE